MVYSDQYHKNEAKGERSASRAEVTRFSNKPLENKSLKGYTLGSQKDITREAHFVQ